MSEKELLHITWIPNPRPNATSPVEFRAAFDPDEEKPITLSTIQPAGLHHLHAKLSWQEWDRLVAWVNWQRVKGL